MHDKGLFHTHHHLNNFEYVVRYDLTGRTGMLLYLQQDSTAATESRER
jgi:hypothetical protein